ncbi:hypothetical protein [Jannaschia formosa]|uniref:hypothetical protein n=1 Tax=Jannaschia formosa TaxID=2259592 RepID=UPI00107539AF|nr:hypothetical protein [Jannaschia formosa]TFL15970.1 hypothetical protein DR046_22550 [Jannaschia formosa]
MPGKTWLFIEQLRFELGSTPLSSATVYQKAAISSRMAFSGYSGLSLSRAVVRQGSHILELSLDGIRGPPSCHELAQQSIGDLASAALGRATRGLEIWVLPDQAF